MLWLCDFINKIIVPKTIQIAADIEKYKKQQKKHLKRQKRIAKEIEFYKQRFKENKNVTGR